MNPLPSEGEITVIADLQINYNQPNDQLVQDKTSNGGDLRGSILSQIIQELEKERGIRFFVHGLGFNIGKSKGTIDKVLEVVKSCHKSLHSEQSLRSVYSTLSIVSHGKSASIGESSSISHRLREVKEVQMKNHVANALAQGSIASQTFVPSINQNIIPSTQLIGGSERLKQIAPSSADKGLRRRSSLPVMPQLLEAIEIQQQQQQLSIDRNSSALKRKLREKSSKGPINSASSSNTEKKEQGSILPESTRKKLKDSIMSKKEEQERMSKSSLLESVQERDDDEQEYEHEDGVGKGRKSDKSSKKKEIKEEEQDTNS